MSPEMKFLYNKSWQSFIIALPFIGAWAGLAHYPFLTWRMVDAVTLACVGSAVVLLLYLAIQNMWVNQRILPKRREVLGIKVTYGTHPIIVEALAKAEDRFGWLWATIGIPLGILTIAMRISHAVYGLLRWSLKTIVGRPVYWLARNLESPVRHVLRTRDQFDPSYQRLLRLRRNARKSGDQQLAALASEGLAEIEAARRDEATRIVTKKQQKQNLAREEIRMIREKVRIEVQAAREVAIATSRLRD